MLEAQHDRDRLAREIVQLVVGVLAANAERDVDPITLGEMLVIVKERLSRQVGDDE